MHKENGQVAHSICFGHAEWSFVCIGREEWASWWETEAKDREREPWAASKIFDYSTRLFASSPCNPSSIVCPRPSCWRQAGAIHGVPWGFHVAVHAAGFFWYLTRSRPPPPSCIRWQGFFFSLHSLCRRKPLFVKHLVVSISIKFAIIRLDWVDAKCYLRNICWNSL